MLIFLWERFPRLLFQNCLNVSILVPNWKLLKRIFETATMPAALISVFHTNLIGYRVQLYQLIVV